jgi:hypothetical protein
MWARTAVAPATRSLAVVVVEDDRVVVHRCDRVHVVCVQAAS